MKSKSRERTLLASVIMSAPGPLVVGLALLSGRSVTQLADFIRRSAELIAIIVSYLVFRIVQKDDASDSAARKEKLERIADVCVGTAMCLSGSVILFFTLHSNQTEKGNVIPGLVIALLGVIANTWFWLRYRTLNRAFPNAILAVQARLYRAKALVDLCVVIALAAVVMHPAAPATR